MAYSKKWLKLLHYEKGLFGYKSLVNSSQFFLSPDGRFNPLNEYQATLKYFNSSNSQAPCRFPARYKLLKKNLTPLRKCHELNEWINGLDAGELYLVYSSAYPNNPASIFGHTFLRFDRKSKNNSIQTKQLLGYSLAFQAKIESDENSLIYTYKGITGGYLSFIEIKPFYQDIGIYNNSESRDLWEYKIDITQSEKNLLLFHVWEILNLASFQYYFFDENCSTLVLSLLESIKPNWNFKSKNDLFVIPQVTLKEIVEKTNKTQFGFRPSIKRKIRKQMSLMSPQEIKSVFNAKKEVELIKNLNSVKQLDLLIDLWKLENYKKKTKISKPDKNRMNETLIRRSQINESSKKLSLNQENQSRAPHLGHGYQGLSISYDKYFMLNYRYGFHTFADPAVGHDEKSYINFLDLTLLRKENSYKVNRINLLEILSLQNYTLDYPHISWNVKIWSDDLLKHNDSIKEANIFVGVGISKIMNNWQLYFIPGVKVSNLFKNNSWLLRGVLRSGFKINFNNHIYNLLEIESQKIYGKFFNQIHYNFAFTLKQSLNMFAGIKYNTIIEKYYPNLGMTYYF